MEGYVPWISYDLHDPILDDGVGEFDEIKEVTDEEKKKIVSLDSALPDELLERILFYLPIASIFRAGCVCKKRHEIVTSKWFCSMLAHVSTQQPWYFMWSTDGPYGYAYDPTLREWLDISLPCFVTSSWFVASSSGLVCFMNNDNRSEFHVYNPLTKCSKNLMEPPGLKHSNYIALAISVDSASQGYAVVVVKSNQVSENFYQWDLSIHVYDSETMMWGTSAMEILNGWRGGYASTICNGCTNSTVSFTQNFVECPCFCGSISSFHFLFWLNRSWLQWRRKNRSWLQWSRSIEEEGSTSCVSLSCFVVADFLSI